MLKRTRQSITSFSDLVTSGNGYFLSDVRMDIPNSRRVIISARANGPAGALMFLSSWVSNDLECVMCERNAKLVANDSVEWTTIRLISSAVPRYATIRLESANAKVEHVMNYRFVADDLNSSER